MGNIIYKNNWYPALLIIILGNGLVQYSINLVNELTIFNVLLVALSIWVIIVLLSLEAERARIHVKLFAGIIMLAGIAGLLSTLILYLLDSGALQKMKVFQFTQSLIVGILLFYFWDQSVEYENFDKVS